MTSASDARDLVARLRDDQWSASRDRSAAAAAELVEALLADGLTPVLRVPVARPAADERPVVEVGVRADEAVRSVEVACRAGWSPTTTARVDDVVRTRAALDLVRPAVDDVELTLRWRPAPDDRPDSAALAVHRRLPRWPPWGPLTAPLRFALRHLALVGGRGWVADLRVTRARPTTLAPPAGAAMNGQVVRREIVARIAQRWAPEQVIETGTYKGHSTVFLAATFGVPVWTVEADPATAAHTRARLGARSDLHLCEGDSVAVLADLAPELGGRPTFFYLDAHWQQRLPLWEELALVGEHWPEAIVLIDDFAVPDDPGYGFDDYGPGQVLDLATLGPHVPAGWSCWFPTVPSGVETGRRRGCVVLAPEALADRLADGLLARI